MEIKYLCPLFQVFDMKTSLDFYCDILGFIVHESAGPTEDLGWVWLKRQNIDLMLNTAYETPDRPSHPDPVRTAAHNDTAIYLGCPDVDEMYSYLNSKSLAIEPPKIAPYGMKQFYLHDPDGYTICFQWAVLNTESNPGIIEL